MRTAITIVRKHGGKEFTLLHGPDVALQEQRGAFKAIHPETLHDTIAELWLWESGNAPRISKFTSPADHKAAGEAAAKAEAKLKAEAEKSARAKADAEAKEKSDLAAANKAATEKAAKDAAEERRVREGRLAEKLK